jgi:hypothetical protein
MKTFKKLYKEFFGIKEQGESKKFVPDTEELATYNKELEKTAQIMKSMAESDLDEAQLINNITDYRGGVEFVLRDPSTAQAVVDDIQQWTAKKGITLVTKKISKSGKVVYMYFRLGQDPASEAQKVQGYLSQMPELKHFRFNVRQPKKKIQPQI